MLMLFNNWINLIIIAFLVLVGYSIASSIQAGAKIATILSVISLGAAFTFIYYWQQANHSEGAE